MGGKHLPTGGIRNPTEIAPQRFNPPQLIAAAEEVPKLNAAVVFLDIEEVGVESQAAGGVRDAVQPRPSRWLNLPLLMGASFLTAKLCSTAVFRHIGLEGLQHEIAALINDRKLCSKDGRRSEEQGERKYEETSLHGKCS
jgi:hypothetical protein